MKKLYEVQHIKNEPPYEVWSLDEPIEEFFADGTEGLVVSDGIVKYNLYTLSIENDGTSNEPKRKKIVTKRIVMPLIRFFELVNRGIHVQKMIQQEQLQKPVNQTIQ